MLVFREFLRTYQLNDSLESCERFSVVRTLRTTLSYQEILLRNNSAEKNWSNMELELIRQGGVWGPEDDSFLEKWMLDDIEGINLTFS